MGCLHPDLDSADRYRMGWRILLVLDVAEQRWLDRWRLMITLIQATPGSGMTLDIGRLAPVIDRLKFAPSNGAQYLDYLRARAHELDFQSARKNLPPDYDQQCYQAHCALRRHAVYLIEVGVR